MNIKNKKIIFPLLTITLLIVFIYSSATGSLELGLGDIFRGIFVDKEGMNQIILLNIRIPRNLVAVAVGINLALSGTALQGVMRNPLADPGIIGVSSGAGFAAFVIMIIFPELFYLVPLGAFVGAMITSMIIYLLAWKDGVTPVRLILSGVAVSAFIGAGINILMTFYPDRIGGAMSFMVGGISGATWKDFYTIIPYTIIGSVLIMIFSNRLNILQMGDEAARGIGLNIEFTRTILILVAALLAASAVSVAGLLGFVGLIIPHLSRLIVGSDYRYNIPSSILLGGAIVLASDTFARMVFNPVEIPVGVVMSAIGAPFFLYMLRENKNYGNRN